jgi:hypothetical protein
MWTADLTPIDSELVTVFVCRFGLGDERDPLTEIKVDVLLGVDALDLDQTNDILLITKSTLISKDCTIDVQTGGSCRRHY